MLNSRSYPNRIAPLSPTESTNCDLVNLYSKVALEVAGLTAIAFSTFEFDDVYLLTLDLLKNLSGDRSPTDIGRTDLGGFLAISITSYKHLRNSPYTRGSKLGNPSS